MARSGSAHAAISPGGRRCWCSTRFPVHGNPAQIVVIRDGDVRRGHGMRATAHDVSLVDALSAAELAGCAPERVAFVGIVPASVTERWGLSPIVGGRVGEMVSAARVVLAGWAAEVPADA